MAEGWLKDVARRFPERERTIEEACARPGPFRDMCEEMADALKALAAADQAPADIREARREEWRSTIDALTQEIEQALSESNVVRLGRASGPTQKVESGR